MPRLLLTLFTSVLAFSAVTSAQTTPATSTRQLTVEELFKKPALANPILSRSGKYLAAVAPFKGRLNLQVINMETRKGDLLTSKFNRPLKGATAARYLPERDKIGLASAGFLNSSSTVSCRVGVAGAAGVFARG